MRSFPLSLAWAASTAMRAASSSSTGTTMPGSTIGSLTKRTGTTLVTPAFSAINPPKLNLLRSTLGEAPLFPEASAAGTRCPGHQERGGHQQADHRQRDH